MSEPLPKNHLTIKGSDPASTSIAIMQYLVGFGLTRWHLVEQDLTMCYVLLTCPAGTPIDGALASFMEIQTTDAKAVHLGKVIVQVLYQDEMTEFRKSAKSKLNRIITLNGVRNKLAHGMATKDPDGEPVFLPFFNLPHDMRYRAYKRYGPVPSTIVPSTEWDEAEVRRQVEKLREGPELTAQLLTDLQALLVDERTTLERAMRMTLDLGLPHDPSPPETPQLEDK